MKGDLKRNLQRALRLSPGDWLLVLAAWWVLLGCAVALRLFSLERLNRGFRMKRTRQDNPEKSLGEARQAQQMVSLAARLHLISMPCLVRACSLHWMLARRGIAGRLCIGMNRSQAGVQAHAWVEVLGQALGEAEDIVVKFHVLEPPAAPRP